MDLSQDVVNEAAGNFELKELKSEKEIKIEAERKKFLKNVLSGNIKLLRDKVGFILNRFSAARNSDLELAWRYWETFEASLFDGKSISKEQLFNLTRIHSLIRCRAKIQNEFKLFQADDRVKRYRGVLEEEKKNEAIEDKPTNLPAYTVYIDESGKNQTHLCVGSLWIIDEGPNTYHIHNEIDEWKNKHDINYEFHFTEVTRSKLRYFKDFFVKFMSLNPTAGFKLISVRNSGFKHESQPITDLTFHLINNGIEHENSSRRAQLPRTLQVWLDEEEIGSDTLKLENLKERLTAQNISGLYLQNFFPISSQGNFFIQATDLFTASVNRKLNGNNSILNHKDELADFVLSLTGFDIGKIDESNTQTDNSVVFNLSGFNLI